MCGIAGVISPNKLTNFDKSTLEGMLNKIFHRGPDANGIWNDGDAWLGHQRLSIVDLSPAGAQPMESQCGNYTIAFNGEIYNFVELRADLDSQYDINWRGDSDTEVILELMIREGVHQSLERFDGMFAFALWDKQKQELVIARDRFGEKPLYYADTESSFCFGSELTCIEEYNGIDLTIDRTALGQFLRFGYVPAPLSIYEQVKKLEPAHYLIFKKGQKTSKHCYWDVSEKAQYGYANKFTGSEEDAINELESLMIESIKRRMRADVPLGAFLSGGIDSSLVVSLMQKISDQKINTFSIGFDDPEMNEAHVAKAVSESLGTNHTEQYINGNDALEVVQKIGDMCDEPFADASLIPTYLVSKLAREKVTVSLSGDSGDELFIGYQRYWSADGVWNKVKKIPYVIRKPIASLINFLPIGVLNVMALPVSAFKGDLKKWHTYSDKLRFASVCLEAKSYKDIYYDFLTRWRNYDELVLDYSSKPIWEPVEPSNINNMELASFKDLGLYMTGHILTKVDRATMAVSLEGRIPMLDHNLVEFSFSVPHKYKWKPGANKHIMRELLYRHVDKSIIDRPKRGFAVPLAEWLRDDLKGWAFNLINPEKIKAQGYLDHLIIGDHWEKHQSGKYDFGQKLWCVIMFQLWLEQRPNLWKKN